jgi:pyruvate kinase
MANICKEAEAALWHTNLFTDLVSKVSPPLDTAHTIAIAAVEASHKCMAGAFIVITTTGRSSHLISKYRPRCPIISVTRRARVARQCHLYRGILPIHYDGDVLGDWMDDVNARVKYGIDYAKNRGILKVRCRLLYIHIIILSLFLYTSIDFMYLYLLIPIFFFRREMQL